MIHMKKFTLRQDWTPMKLDVSVEMPEELDITHLRGNGPQKDEDILPQNTGIFTVKFVLLNFIFISYMLIQMVCLFHLHTI